MNPLRALRERTLTAAGWRTALQGLLLVTLLTTRLADAASPNQEVEAVLARAEAPSGVVFEVVSSRENALQRVLPDIKRYAERLKARFPEIGVAVVSHGSEQFSLLSENQPKYAGLHQSIEALVKSEDIPVHVCGGHASWRDNVPEDFPKFVDVAPSGPGQIRVYEDMGYVLIIL